MFEIVDDIINIGKSIYPEIPEGDKCNKCPLLRVSSIRPYCLLRSNYSLSFANGDVFKDDKCPKGKSGEVV